MQPDGIFLYGVVNASPDSLNTDSIVTTADQAVARARQLLADGANGIDMGGQGSTDAAEVVPWTAEWDRLKDLVPAVAALGVPLSVDTWRPEVLRLALQHGATVINAADGMQSDAMWEVAADFDVPIVVPFLSGPNPRAMEMVDRDPVDAIIEFFDARLRDADRYGLRHRCILDPGTGFAPPNWPWEERYVYQKRVYSNLDAMRVFGLPL
ncbi:MAG TPA: dihydropteroate synthase, partial [Ilumatobacteraceae bacterium]|nr:dihydropteroate synthase [Ilumatobacteraceae bacterium]